MDIRGVEITNQLRSAIQAKLLELGVRYDEELPDYILVMVVNKKSRQHMHEDLFLFLEDSTQTFVDWLHDQVLKKLQKVTIAKKKNEKEFTPISNIKEEVIKKEEPLDNKLTDKVKKDRDNEFDQLVGDLALLNEEKIDSQDSTKETNNSKENKTPALEDSLDSEKITSTTNSKVNSADKILETNELNETNDNLNTEDEPSTTPKRIWSAISSPELSESPSKEKTKKFEVKKIIPLKRSSDAFRKSKTPDKVDPKKIKLNESIKIKENDLLTSSKPKISSVVTIKSRLGIFAPSNNKQEIQDKTDNGKFSPSKKIRLDTKESEISSENNKVSKKDNVIRLKKNNESNIDQIKNDNYKNIKGIQITSTRNKERLVKIGSVKSRLGMITNQASDDDEPKMSNDSRKIIKISNVKSRLGKKIEPTHSDDFIDEDILEDIYDDLDSESLTTSLRSKIIAIKKPDSVKNLKHKILLKNKRSEIMSEEEIDDDEDTQDQGKLSSKVIVTPRPLKPLQPSQKRATQSLLLKAVAEANKSVVTQRKKDPCLKDKKDIISKKETKSWQPGKKLSVNLNAKQKLADNLEKIKIELKNPNAVRRKRRSPTPQTEDDNDDDYYEEVNNHDDNDNDDEDDDEQMKFVKSLFEKNNRTNPKFLVTLNGYNNNVTKKKEISSDEDENHEIKNHEVYDINAEQKFLPKNQKNQSKPYTWIEEKPKLEIKKNSNRELKNFYLKQKLEALKKQNSENESNSSSTKKRKIIPIVYTRSRSPSPENTTVNSVAPITATTSVENKPLSSVVSTLEDKSGEKCRYWPNCTLGMSCSYYHPEVPCSSFPACVFGDKCAYVHPKCKFGSACTKAGCIFSHPPLQCKYHPFCMKPGCPFSHPKTISSQAILEMTSQRSKFTWKKQE